MKPYCILILFLITNSCVDSLDITTDRKVSHLVVEGYITTLPGPHFISLSRSAKYGNVFEDVSRKEISAFVRIMDNGGNQVILEETNKGIYVTPRSFRAEVGKSYTLFVNTFNGERYSSIPEIVPKVSPIDSIIVAYKRLPSSSETEIRVGAEIFVQSMDPVDEENFYWWANSGTYFIKTFPDEFTVPNFGFGQPNLPAPKDCCAECWVTEQNGDQTLHLFKDNNSNGQRISQMAAFIEDDGGRYLEKYLVRIDQLSLTKEAYQFYNLVGQQLSITGDIFDPPPATITGNMVNLDDPDAQVIGYFFASDASRDSVFIHRDQLEVHRADLHIPDDCRLLNGSSTKRPEYW